MYIYIYIEREREREGSVYTTTATATATTTGRESQDPLRARGLGPEAVLMHMIYNICV